MTGKKGNDRERERHRIEDKIIAGIDKERGEACSWPEPGPLRVPIIDLLVWKATIHNRPIKACCF